MVCKHKYENSATNGSIFFHGWTHREKTVPNTVKSPLTSLCYRPLVGVHNQRFLELSLTFQISAGKDTITRRETEILYLMSQGKASKEIAAYLHISTQTVQKHTKNIYRKLDVHNKIEALNKTRWLIASLFSNQN